MTSPFIGQIKLFPYGFAPKGWAICQGQVLSVSAFTSLASLLGTNFGGNGTTTFGLPDLRGRVAMGAFSPGHGLPFIGMMLGAEQVQLTQQTFGHTHALNCTTNPGTTNTSTHMQFATARGGDPQKPDKANIYNPDTGNPDAQLGSDNAVPSVGGDQPHNNMQPYLTMNYCIALQGIMPPRQ